MLDALAARSWPPPIRRCARRAARIRQALLRRRRDRRRGAGERGGASHSTPRAVAKPPSRPCVTPASARVALLSCRDVVLARQRVLLRAEVVCHAGAAHSFFLRAIDPRSLRHILRRALQAEERCGSPCTTMRSPRRRWRADRRTPLAARTRSRRPSGCFRLLGRRSRRALAGCRANSTRLHREAAEGPRSFREKRKPRLRRNKIDDPEAPWFHPTSLCVCSLRPAAAGTVAAQAWPTAKPSPS
jgi:hypothetical protein